MLLPEEEILLVFYAYITEGRYRTGKYLIGEARYSSYS
jgi:hypothetical protein